MSDARACRTPAAQRSTRSTPAVWSFEGGLAETIDRLLELPLPGTPLAPILAKRSVPDLTLAGMNPFQLWTPPGQIA
ncbi:MAG: hypothetical protein JO285_01255 [Kutzneria sp.]|nr:hypothetical protein [Kutzneria sp.]